MAGLLVLFLSLVLIGLLCFLAAYLSWLRKRLVENLPRSKIRSVAMGLVEIAGNADSETLFTAPFSQKPCVYYHYEMQEVRTAKGGTYWVTLLQGTSELAPFYVEDDTGQVLVDPHGADLELNVTFDLTVEHHEKVPEHLAAFLDAAHYRYKNWFGQHCTMRFRERAIAPKESIYVMGVCQNNRRLSQTEWEMEKSQNSDNNIFIGKRSSDVFFISSDGERDMLAGLSKFIVQAAIFGTLFLLLGAGGLWLAH